MYKTEIFIFVVLLSFFFVSSRRIPKDIFEAKNLIASAANVTIIKNESKDPVQLVVLEEKLLEMDTMMKNYEGNADKYRKELMVLIADTRKLYNDCTLPVYKWCFVRNSILNIVFDYMHKNVTHYDAAGVLFLLANTKRRLHNDSDISTTLTSILQVKSQLESIGVLLTKISKDLCDFDVNCNHRNVSEKEIDIKKFSYSKICEKIKEMKKIGIEVLENARREEGMLKSIAGAINGFKKPHTAKFTPIVAGLLQFKDICHAYITWHGYDTTSSVEPVTLSQ